MPAASLLTKQTMQLALTVLEIVAPVFPLAAVGFVWVKLGFEYRVEFVTRFAMTLSVPCLIFTALMGTQIDAAALGALFLWQGWQTPVFLTNALELIG